MSDHTNEVSEVFWEGMKNRMYVSYFKYGPVADAFPDKIDAIASLRLCLGRYAETGNTEYLMDAANYAMIEFMYPRHPKGHFRATDSDESVGRIEHGNETPVQFPNRDLLPMPPEK